MKIQDLTNNYIQNVLIKNEPEKYINSFPELFNHYFKYWCSNKHFNFNITSEIIKKHSKKIVNKLPIIEKAFLKNGIDIKDIEIILFVGNNTSNGHAFKYKDKYVVWIPIETYTSIKLIEVFVPHEIAHAIHYRLNPELYFITKKEQHNLFRQLITEGIASFVSMKINNINEKTTLWADYLSVSKIKEWYLDCENNKTVLAKYVLENFDKPLPITNFLQLTTLNSEIEKDII